MLAPTRKQDYFPPWSFQLLLMVRRCNGTTAGLGYWKVGLEWPYKLPPGQSERSE
jgi:hypothetical protein